MKTEAVFARPHHRAIAHMLSSLDSPVLKTHACYFGGGTVIAMRYGEFRESVDIDFLVSELGCYRQLRELLTGANGIAAITRKGAVPLVQNRDVRADQYGIRTMLSVADITVKFEIVHEGRIQLETPGVDDEVCGIATLTALDMATCKLLANSDRWADDGVFNRDLIDLAMMGPSLPRLRQAVIKAQAAYGKSVLADLSSAITRVQTREGWLERCMKTMAMTIPKALLWKRIRALQKVLPSVGGEE